MLEQHGREISADEVHRALARSHEPESPENSGERLAAMIYGQSDEDLKTIAKNFDNETGNACVDLLMAAEQSLAGRLALVRAAAERLALAAQAGSER